MFLQIQDGPTHPLWLSEKMLVFQQYQRHYSELIYRVIYNKGRFVLVILCNPYLLLSMIQNGAKKDQSIAPVEPDSLIFWGSKIFIALYIY